MVVSLGWIIRIVVSEVRAASNVRQTAFKSGHETSQDLLVDEASRIFGIVPRVMVSQVPIPTTLVRVLTIQH